MPDRPWFSGRPRPLGNIGDVGAGLMENADHRSTAVVAPLENQRGQGHEPPEQIEGFRRVRLGDRLDNCSALNFEVIGQGSRALPVYKPPRPRNDREPLAHLLGEFGRAPGTGQLHSQASFGGRVASTDIDQQYGQPLEPEGSEVFALRADFAATRER